MTTLSQFLMAFIGVTAGVALCGLMNRHPDRRSSITVTILCVVAAVVLAVLAVIVPRSDCYHPQHVQAVWLDGAWRCITTEQAG